MAMLPLLVVLAFWAFMLIPLLAVRRIEQLPTLQKTPIGAAANAFTKRSRKAPILAPADFWGTLMLSSGQAVYLKALPQAAKRKAIMSRVAVEAENKRTTEWLRDHSTRDLQLFGIERALLEEREHSKVWALTEQDHQAAYAAAKAEDPFLASVDWLPKFRALKDCKWCTWTPDRSKDVMFLGDQNGWIRSTICPDHGGEVREKVPQRDCPDCGFVHDGSSYYDSERTIRRTKPCWRHGGPPKTVGKAMEKVGLDPKAGSGSAGTSRGGDPLKKVVRELNSDDFRQRITRIRRAQKCRQDGELGSIPQNLLTSRNFREDCPACVRITTNTGIYEFICAEHRDSETMRRQIEGMLRLGWLQEAHAEGVDSVLRVWAGLNDSDIFESAVKDRVGRSWKLLALLWDLAIGLEQIGDSGADLRTSVLDQFREVAGELAKLANVLVKAEQKGVHCSQETVQRHLKLALGFKELSQFLKVPA